MVVQITTGNAGHDRQLGGVVVHIRCIRPLGILVGDPWIRLGRVLRRDVARERVFAPTGGHRTSMAADGHRGMRFWTKMCHVDPATVNGHTLAPDPRFDSAMLAALAMARSAGAAGEVPIGAAVIRPDESGSGYEVLAECGNQREGANDPTAHAEILALREAARSLRRWRLDDCILVVTLEPCPMCAGAAWASRIGGVVFGATNDDAGAAGTLYHLGQDPRLNHEFPTRGGVRAAECTALLQDFFGRRR